MSICICIYIYIYIHTYIYYPPISGWIRFLFPLAMGGLDFRDVSNI